MKLSEFEGTWTLTRKIEDHLTNQTHAFFGTANLTPNGEGLAYRETGTLKLAGAAPMTSERRYLWRSDGSTILVLFDDGRPFHHIAPEDKSDAHHDCPPDTYDVSYDFTGWPNWRATWRVRGPRKDYTMTTDYAR